MRCRRPVQLAVSLPSLARSSMTGMFGIFFRREMSTSKFTDDILILELMTQCRESFKATFFAFFPILPKS